MAKNFASAIARTVSLISHDVETLIETLSADFASDYGHFARSNNRDRMEQGLASLVKAKPLHAAIIQAIDAGVKAGALVQGYIGAHNGPYAKQTSENVATFENAMTLANAAFTATLTQCEALQPKTPKTKEEKEKAKTEKAEKASEAIETLINAKIQAGELVRASAVRAYPQEEIDALKLEIETLKAENATLLADMNHLQVEYSHLVTVHTKLTSAKKSKAVTV